MSKHKHSRGAAPSRPRRDLPLSDLLGIVERAKASLSETDYTTLKAAVDTLGFLTLELEAKGTTVERLRKWLFGASTEKTRDVIVDTAAGESAGAESTGGAAPGTPSPDDKSDEPKPKPPGHGRNGAAAFRGAKKIKVPHGSLRGGLCCPECQKGKVYPLAEPAVRVRVQGMAPLSATVYELDRMRCNLCGEVYTAEAPAGVGDDKYDETAASMIGLLKYGAGLPFNRIEKLEKGLGIPLPAPTQWQVVEAAAELIEPAHAELIHQAAQGEVLHNDDTTAKILEFAKASQAEPTDGSDARARTGVFTSGVVARCQEHPVALFFTGRKHAGENLADVLSHRAAALAAPIQMSDALSRNQPGEFKTIVSHCLAHARRRFVDVVDAFPDEVTHLLNELSEPYKNDALARQRGLSPTERLSFHQTESAPVMARLAVWLREQIEQRKVEPNSGLGEAITYTRKHWSALTQFLHVAGAPLDNNVCERALKKAILHRKNAYFFKTQNGAHVGDVFMSLIHTAELNGRNPFDYLVALQRHHPQVKDNPAEWMPWNYTEAMARVATVTIAPS